MPIVDSVVLTDSATITFTGQNFFTSGYTPKAQFNGVDADEVTIDSVTTVTAKWNKGVPTTGAATAPKLWFVKASRRLLAASDDSPLQHYATNAATLENPLEITASTSGLSCSFAGGCNYEVTAKGLSTLLTDSKNNNIEVCGNVCEYQPDESNSDKAVCRVPQISTTYSDREFKIAESTEMLKTGVYFGTNDKFGNAFDGDLLNNSGDDSADCEVGMSFKEKHVGLISQVKFFMGDIQDKTLWVDKLKFQGSNDKTEWTDIFTQDENINEGWNYHSWTDAADYKAFRHYRFFGPVAKSCKINEI